MSDLQGRRIPGEEGSRRRRPLLWLILGLLLLLLLAALVPFACQAINGTSGQGGGGSGAQGAADGEGEGANGAGESGAAQDGGKSGAGGASDGQADPEGPQDAATARLEARDQSGEGETVTVPEATVDGTKGWLAVRADDNGEPGEVLGRAPLREGSNGEVRVELRQPLDSSQKLYATIHAERPVDGDFTYPDGDPTLEQEGRTVIEPISYTVRDNDAGDTAGDAAGDAASEGGIRDDELPESGGVSPAALLAAGVVLLLVSAWGLRAALRQSGAGV
ncbi:MAG TPA: hypothetical protein VGR18_02925 [Rubrobacter sp.]|nr:hypothetical protein [Rubrobacter sp.]